VIVKVGPEARQVSDRELADLVRKLDELLIARQRATRRFPQDVLDALIAADIQPLPGGHPFRTEQEAQAVLAALASADVAGEIERVVETRSADDASAEKAASDGGDAAVNSVPSEPELVERGFRVVAAGDCDVNLLLSTKHYVRIRVLEHDLRELARPPLVVEQGENRSAHADRVAFLEDLRGRVKQGWAIQRYKGLGEMNPEQLWETTLDPERRVLLQVKIEDFEAAEKVIDVLMGEEVEGRRRFIEQHALDAENIDI
jgi:DNA gyrase subunit B